MYVKICGVTSVDDAVAAVASGADAVGVNLVESSPRRVSVEQAAAIVGAVGGRARVVLVVAGCTAAEGERLRRATGASWLQLHGDEPPDVLDALLPSAYKAVRVGGPADALRASAYGGDELLVDAKVDGVLGGSGVRVDPALVVGLARTRRIVLAGGLTPENVGDAVRAVRPFGVDVASGVESRAGVKDPRRVRAFVAAARRASSV